ncbi:hypothetical protein [Chondromyces apiculatus]|uniref:Tetratricopeptide repeat protein n=1 Tax=Chondromyces apiculatus DSM 436 TaxID=1192034 RepID=A0A017TGB3_9BACT|nr:hypothetical protein [Chondromyces apiculatus]EYF08338.1 Hypothetical protein CAP_6099 [Chondromyces apiculatus DSM 436]
MPRPRFIARLSCALVPALAALILAQGAAHAQGAAAAPKDAQAEKAITAAMDSDFLETKFDKAQQKLQAALDACGDTGCSKAVKARLYVALGTVLAHGLKELEDARDAFTEGLKLDPGVKPDPDLNSTAVSFAFEQARTALTRSSTSTGLTLTPPPEQAVNTPIPVYAEIREDLLARTQQVTLSYQAPGASAFKPLLMKKLRDRGYGINIPCVDLTAEGPVRYYLVATDKDGAIVATAGSREAPLTTAVKKTLSGAPPSWPDFAPPTTCAVVEAEKPASQCLDDRQCNEGLQCSAGACVPRPPPPPPDTLRRNWVSLSFGPDVSLFSGEGVCSLQGQSEQNYVCLRDDDTRYDGVPTGDVANNVNPGFALGTLRLALGYERMLLENVSVGARVGFAFLGTSDGGASFMPLHLEARGQYYLLPRALKGVGVSPYVLLSTGLAQVDSHVDVQTYEDAAACGANVNDPASPCTHPSGGTDRIEEPRLQTLRATKQAGLGFLTAGAGIKYEPHPGLALNVAVRAGLTFPVVTMLIAPELGVGIGF